MDDALFANLGIFLFGAVVVLLTIGTAAVKWESRPRDRADEAPPDQWPVFRDEDDTWEYHP